MWMRRWLLVVVGLATIGFTGSLLADDGGSAWANLDLSRLRILEPIGVHENSPPIEKIIIGEIVQLQVSYPISPPFPQNVEAKASERSLTVLGIAGTEGKVVALPPGKSEEGKIGVGFFSVFLRANNIGNPTVEVKVTFSDESVRRLTVKFDISEPKMSKGAVRVTKITDIKYSIERKSEPTLIVTALGQVPTLGWTKATLVRRIYIQPPPDGIWEYDLYATPPSGVAAQAISSISARNDWQNFDESLVKGVRVFGEGNGVMEKRFDEEPPATARNGEMLRIPQAFAHVFVYKQPLKSQDKVMDGHSETAIKVEDGAFLVWVDLMPYARFAHPTKYIIMGPKKTTVVQGNWWPIVNGEAIFNRTAPNYTIHLPFPLPPTQPAAQRELAAYPLALTTHDQLTDGPEGKPISIKEPTTLIWVDLQPGAKFAHPALHLLVSRDDARVIEGNWFPILNGKRILYGSDESAPNIPTKPDGE